MAYTYLDSNVYNDIERGTIPTADFEDSVEAVKNGRLVVRAGLVDFEEILGVWKSDRQVALRRLRVLRDLAGFDKLLNQPSDLLAGAIQAYAAGASPGPDPGGPAMLIVRRGRVGKGISIEPPNRPTTRRRPPLRSSPRPKLVEAFAPTKSIADENPPISLRNRSR